MSDKNILYNCRKATFLIEKKSFVQLSIREQVELKLHLAGCSVCRLFMQQSLFINQMVKKHLQNEKDIPNLDESFKQGLAKRIQVELEDNEKQ